MTYQQTNDSEAAICGLKPSAFTGSPTADAEAHFDALADTYMTAVEYHGMALTVEINRPGNCLVDILDADGNCWLELLSEKALRQVRKLADEVVIDKTDWSAA